MPARFSDIARIGRKHYGLKCVEPNSGSHWKVSNPAGKSFRVKAHNGMKSEISNDYIEGLCRCFEIEKAEFFARLRRDREQRLGRRLHAARFGKGSWQLHRLSPCGSSTLTATVSTRLPGLETATFDRNLAAPSMRNSALGVRVAPA